MPIRIGRWHIEIYRRGIEIIREPHPDCPDCRGRGGQVLIAHDGHADWDDCHCTGQLRTWRLPLWRRPATDERYPF